MVCKRGAYHDSMKFGASTYIWDAVCCCSIDGDIAHGGMVGLGSASESPSVFIGTGGGWAAWRGPGQKLGHERR